MSADIEPRAVGPYTIIASHITAAPAYGYDTRIVYMLARHGKIIADDDAASKARATGTGDPTLADAGQRGRDQHRRRTTEINVVNLGYRGTWQF